MNPYNRVPYPGSVIAAAQIRRLESIGTLFHLQPASCATARVLELGCGSGENLAAQALTHPRVRFVGCDASATAITAAQELAGTLGLSNVEFRCQDLREVDAGWGTFDYILCHGVFSWVGPDARQRILTIVRDRLAANGIGYVSYNTMPGWHLRGVVRDLICHHAGGFDEPGQVIAQARAIVGLAAEAQRNDDPYSKLIREEYYFLSRAPDGYLYHEMLEEHNEAFYFHEFVDQIESAGLRYLGDAELSQMFTWDLPAAARSFLEEMPLPEREQYLDFLRGAAFRRSLVCHAEAHVDWQLDYRTLGRFCVALSAEARLEIISAGDAEPPPGALGCCKQASLITNSCGLSSDESLTVAALCYLNDHRPEFVPVAMLKQRLLRDLSDGASGTASAPELRPNSEQASDRLLRFLLDAVTAGALEATLSAPRVTSRISDRPTASLFARHEARRGRTVTNEWQQPIQLTDASRFVVTLLDGSRDRSQLIAAVGEELKAERISLSPLDQADDDESFINVVLNRLAQLAMLVA